MFNLFNKNTPDKPRDIKAIREAMLFFIKQEMQKMEGGEGRSIKGLQLCIACLPEERYLYDAAVFSAEENRFKQELQRLADDFAIDLPERWTLDIAFLDELPEGAVKMDQLDVALCIKMPEITITQKSDTAFLRVLNGEAEQQEYTISAADGRINIGRERLAQDQDGFVRENHIAFPDGSSNQANKYVSRQHAHIIWNEESAAFMLFADDGGVPPRNKVKVKSPSEHNPVKLTFTELGHALQEGDQIILGESAVLEFSYSSHQSATV
ncbi:FHA domain-containing protein [Pedobacter deserti]|uniref:FHA domain-containing protein n=1 Tax=Pedobacter deserti TaxID=2817382 RepID=UPI00210F031F|nr:FHA domain-containing protein [Pedobacter sp. SYSU D00382]